MTDCFDLRRLAGLTSEIDIFLDQGKKGNSQVIIMGAGYAMPAIARILNKNGFNIVAICDSDLQKRGQIFIGIKCCAIDEAIALYPNAQIVIASPRYFAEIKRELSEKVLENQIVDLDLDNTHYFYKYEFKSFLNHNISRFEFVLSLLDSESKNTFYKVLLAHSSGRRLDFVNASTGQEDWYLFKTLLESRHNSIFIDCGAYTGDTISLFLEASRIQPKKVIAYEPEPQSFGYLEKYLAETNVGYEAHMKGLAAYCNKRMLRVEDVYSAFTEKPNHSGDIEVESVCLDDIEPSIVDADIIIKMDIEGGEYDALLGARQIITKHRPRLAICLYHKVEDLVRIAELLYSLQPDYKFHVKHQSTGCTDTILFAV